MSYSTQYFSHVVVLPKRGPNLERIIICKLSFKTSEEDYIDIERCILTAVSTAILMYVKDYNSVCQVLVDFKGVKISHLQKLNLNNIHKLYNMYEVGRQKILRAVIYQHVLECIQV
jgi:hypothetical protein